MLLIIDASLGFPRITQQNLFSGWLRLCDNHVYKTTMSQEKIIRLLTVIMIFHCLQNFLCDFTKRKPLIDNNNTIFHLKSEYFQDYTCQSSVQILVHGQLKLIETVLGEALELAYLFRSIQITLLCRGIIWVLCNRFRRKDQG